MSILNLPLYPATDQVAESGGVYYKWTGSKWKRLDTEIYRSFVENTAYKSYSGNTVTLDTERYNFHDITASESLTISIPSTTTLYDTFRVAVKSTATAIGWDLDRFSYENKSFYVGGQEIYPSGLFFKPDGTKMYVAGQNADRVQEYVLSTAWDVSTDVYSTSYYAGTQTTSVYDVHFSSDGTKMYIMGQSADTIYQYTLSTPWLVSSASYASISFSFTSYVGYPQAFTFSRDGTKIYVSGEYNGSYRIAQYNLGTAWNLSTATIYGYISTTTAFGNVYGMYFSEDGTKLFVANYPGNKIGVYTLTTPWDILTATLLSTTFSTTSQSNSPYAIFFKSDGRKMYITLDFTDRVYQYTAPTPVTITWPDNVLWENGVAPSLDDVTSTYIFELTAVSGNSFVGKLVHQSSGA